jgi:SAM-dependent methyltransferase
MSETLAEQQFWDNFYQNYEIFIANDNDPVIRWMNRYIGDGEGKQCLEFGCFPGRYLAWLGKKGYVVNGIDLTPRVEEDLPAFFQKAGIKTGFLKKEDFFEYNSTDRFDLVCSFGFIEHFPAFKDLILKHAAYVAPGGLLAITTPNFKGWVQHGLHQYLDKANLGIHHIPAMSPEIWADVLRKEGFEIITSGYFGGFDFWAEAAERDALQRLSLKLIVKTKKIWTKLLPEDSKATSAFCGIIARRPAR